jgi:glyoxylase-like metal-dependent hydrolase (beta-lactamase superfamily II)
MHGDHFTNYVLFPNAKIVVNGNGFPNGIESAPEDMRERLVLVGDEDVLPGIRTFHLGLHSEDSQGIAVDTPKGTVVLSGDVAYMFENLESDRPIRCEDIEGARAALRTLKSHGDIILPGHDPAILDRYPDGIIA